MRQAPYAALAIASAIYGPGGAWAQRGAVEQLAPAASAADRTASGQIVPNVRSVSPGDIAPGTALMRPPVTAPSQLTAARDGRAPAQLAPARRSARGPAQVAPSGRSAQPPAPLSTTAEGRTVATARVQGRDRCDPAARPAPGAGCGAVLETRGGDFPPPSAEPLSPEQRLLAEQRALEPQRPAGDAIARSAARRVGRDGADADAPAMQGIASLVLAPPAPPPPPVTDPTSGLSPEQAAIATDIIGAVGTTQP